MEKSQPSKQAGKTGTQPKQGAKDNDAQHKSKSQQQQKK